MVDHEPLLPVVSAAVTDLYNRTFWLDHLPLIYMLFLLSLGETNCNQTALKPVTWPHLMILRVRETVGLWLEIYNFCQSVQSNYPNTYSYPC